MNAMERILDATDQAAEGPVRDRDLCVLIMLDVKNTFNTTPWQHIDAALRRKRTPGYLARMVRSYLEEKTLLVGEEMLSRAMTCGIPQGSVMEPTLWNTLYDGLLEIPMPPGASFVEFVDDLVILATAHTTEILKDTANPVLQCVSGWKRTGSPSLHTSQRPYYSRGNEQLANTESTEARDPSGKDDKVSRSDAGW